MSEDKTGTVRDLLQHWEGISAGRRRAARSPTDDPARKGWLEGYAQALDAARVELAERLDAQPDDVQALCIQLREALQRHAVALGDSQDAIFESLRRLGAR